MAGLQASMGGERKATETEEATQKSALAKLESRGVSTKTDFAPIISKLDYREKREARAAIKEQSKGDKKV